LAYDFEIAKTGKHRHTGHMKYINSKLKDPAQIAHAVVQAATEPEADPLTPEDRKTLTSLLGRLGGRRGGLARAASLSKKQRINIALKGAKARWKNHKKKR
jgi:hypothetical protein